jgi:hypothetical protein
MRPTLHEIAAGADDPMTDYKIECDQIARIEKRERLGATMTNDYITTIDQTLTAYDQGRPEDADAGDALIALGRLLLDRLHKQAAAHNAYLRLKEIELALMAPMAPLEAGRLSAQAAIARIDLEVTFGLGEATPAAVALATKEAK